MHISLGSKHSRGQELGACGSLRGLLAQFPVNKILLTTDKKTLSASSVHQGVGREVFLCTSGGSVNW